MIPFRCPMEGAAMKMKIVLAGLVMLAGCATPEERLARYRARCERDFGFTPNTDAFSNCLMQQENQRQRSIDAALAAPMPVYVPPAFPR